MSPSGEPDLLARTRSALLDPSATGTTSGRRPDAVADNNLDSLRYRASQKSA
jgi:hypothetical protein